MPGKKIALVCPLDWGIGHATRCAPIIAKLRELGFEIVVAAAGRPLEFIRTEFPGVRTIKFEGTHISYPKGGRMALKMMQLLPGLLMGIWQEHRQIKKIARQSRASIIISDNRYGCWHASIPSVFITHQLDIHIPNRLRVFKPLINRINYWFIRKYDECWIPDFELHRGLAGDLSHPRKLTSNAKYVGILSRFSALPSPIPELQDTGFEILVMLSGPEPQRTILEEKILNQLVNIDMQVAVVRGMPESEEAYVLDKRIHVFAHLNSIRLRELINRSSLVICRSGYSSIMDIVSLGKRAIFIPTPGQPEQEYLARYLMEKKIFFSMAQEDFELLYALEMSKNFPGMMMRNDYTVLEERMKRLCP